MNLILITGGSSSGKTTITKKLSDLFDNVTAISMDDYYFDKYHFDDSKNINWDSPNSFNWELLIFHLNELKKGKIIKKKQFQYGSNIHKGIKILKPNEIVIVEGILAAYNEDIRAISSKLVFLDSRNEIRYLRRLRRDMKLIKNFNEEKYLSDWINNIAPTYKEFIEPMMIIADIVLDTNKIETEIDNLVAEISNKLVK